VLTIPERAGRRFLNAMGFRSRRVDTSAGRLHVLDKRGGGSLPPVVLLHGLSANSVSFSRMLRRLAPHVRRIVAPDLPGHGFSKAPRSGFDADTLTDALFQVLDQLIDEPALVLGTSMGGFCAARYASARPERVKRLILVSPGGAPEDEASLQRFLDTFRIDDRAQAMEFVDNLFAKQPGLLRHALARGIHQRFSNASLREMIDGMSAEQLLRPEELRTLEMPTLLVWGKQERILPAHHLEFYREHLPGHAEIEMWDRFGHIGFLEQSEAIAQRVLSFAGLDAALAPAKRSPLAAESEADESWEGVAVSTVPMSHANMAASS
jgi:pimeloyl-ACP methyl ester carboxylesterase